MDNTTDSHKFTYNLFSYEELGSYAIKNYFDEIDPLEIDNDRDSTGSNYNVGSVDGDKFISKFIEALYPDTKAPYKITRGLMIFGLEKLGELLEQGQLYPLSNIM